MSDWSRIPHASIQAIIERHGDPATAAWAHEGTGSLADLADPMLGIAAALALGNVAALQSVGAPKDLKKAAASALHRLRSSGVKVQTPAPRASFQLSQETSFPAPRAFVAAPDGSGEVEFMLTVSDAEESCAIGLRAVSPALITDSGHSHLSRTELRNTWSEVQKHGLVEIPFTTGLHWADRLIGSTHAFQHFLEHVPAPALTAARTLPPRTLPPVDEPEIQLGKSWALSNQLWDLTAINPAVEEIFRSVSAAPGEDIEQNGNARYEATVNRVTAGMITDQNRAAVADSLSFFAEIFALTGRAASADYATRLSAAIQRADPIAAEASPLRQSAALAIAKEAQSRMEALMESSVGPGGDDELNFEEED